MTEGLMGRMTDLNKAIDEAKKLYSERGFQKRLGFGKQPALLIIDLAVAWTHPEYPLGSDLSNVVEDTKDLLVRFREKGMMVVFTGIAYERNVDELGLLAKKTPAVVDVKLGTHATEIDPRIKPVDGEIVIYKKAPSAFFGTNLSSILTCRRIDTIIVTGCVTSTCIRATVMDGFSYGFRPIIPRECVGDRAPGPHEWSLFDIDAKCGDVVSKAEVLKYLEMVHNVEE